MGSTVLSTGIVSFQSSSYRSNRSSWVCAWSFNALEMPLQVTLQLTQILTDTSLSCQVCCGQLPCIRWRSCWYRSDACFRPTSAAARLLKVVKQPLWTSLASSLLVCKVPSSLHHQLRIKFEKKAVRRLFQMSLTLVTPSLLSLWSSSWLFCHWPVFHVVENHPYRQKRSSACHLVWWFLLIGGVHQLIVAENSHIQLYWCNVCWPTHSTRSSQLLWWAQGSCACCGWC